MLCFHGMTEKAYANLFNSAGNDVISPWSCSNNDGMTYLHTIEFAMEETGEDEEDARGFAIQQAKESAMIQAAINGDSKLFVIEIELPDEELEIDYSCSNMEYCRCIDSEIFTRYVKELAIIHSFEINPAFHAFILAGLVNNEQLNTEEIPSGLMKAARIISKLDYSEIYDDIWGY